jgi:hypothetical protein
MGLTLSPNQHQPKTKMNELTTTTTPANPFQRAGLSEHANAGTVEIESARAIAEAQGKLVIAKRFPRNEALAFDEAMQACRRNGLAEDAFWSFPRGRETITGSSIHLARELARVWGNIEYNIRELSRKDGVSEMQAFAWDLQTNTLVTQNFTVRHWRDTRSGGYALTDERDIYELTANQGARRLRSCIFGVLPSDLVRASEEECKRTLAGSNDVPIKDRARAMVGSFSKLGVTAAMIEARLGHSLDAILPEELGELRSIYTSIKSGVTKAGEWFGGSKPAPEASNILEGDTTPALEAAPAPTIEPPAPKPAKTAKAKPPVVDIEPEPVAVQVATDDGDIFG